MWQRPNPRDLIWDLRFLFGHYDDDWYLSLFKPARKRMPGEISPSYCFLKEPDIRHVNELLPEVRVIMLLRDPIERAWSTLRKNRLTKHPIDIVTRILERPALQEPSQYARNLRNWRGILGPERVFIGFFEEVRERPVGLMSRIHSFLGVRDLSKELSGFAETRFNASPPKSLPRDFSRAAARMFLPLLQDLEKKVGDQVVMRWIERAESALS